jgi:hypothetical protein
MERFTLGGIGKVAISQLLFVTNAIEDGHVDEESVADVWP